MEKSEGLSSEISVHIPAELVLEILVRSPAKSVARFRCVCTTWLFMSTDPSFILSHARRAPKSCLMCSISPHTGVFLNRLLSLSANIVERNFGQKYSDVPLSSYNGLVFFSRVKELHTKYYVVNLLTGMQIDLPNPLKIGFTMMFSALYYHRWTGEYRIVNIHLCKTFTDEHLDAQVLNLVGNGSWRQIKAKTLFVDLCYQQDRVLVIDHLYWRKRNSDQRESILGFDILNEAFCLMKPPPYVPKNSHVLTNYRIKSGLMDMEGSLCYWVFYNDNWYIDDGNIDIWVSVDGDEKWKKTYSLRLVGECNRLLRYQFSKNRHLNACFCTNERKFVLLFNNTGYEIYLFQWDLISGKYSIGVHPSEFNEITYSFLSYKETLVNLSLSPTVTGVPK